MIPDVQTSRFTNSNGVLLMRALFFETAKDTSGALYTLKSQDFRGLPSLERMYLQEEDPTEYRFASKYLDSYSHWEALTQAGWFQPYVNKWRRDLTLKIKAKALHEIVKMAEDADNKNHFTANKFLLDEGWGPRAGKGRPSKKAVISAMPDLRIEDDLARVLGNA